MRQQIGSYIDSAITLFLLILAGATPLLFLNQTTEFYEMPKLALLSVMTIILIGLWIFSWIIKGKVVITRTPLDLPLLILLVVVLVSTFFSETRFPSIYGNFPRVHGSAISWVTYILLYFVTVSNLNSLSKIKSFLYVLYGSGVVVALVSIMSFFGIFLPLNFAAAVNFTPTGSTFSTIAFLLLLLPLPLVSLVRPNSYLLQPFAMALSILFGVTVALLGGIPTYVGLFLVFLLVALVAKPHKVRGALTVFMVPVLVTGLVLALAYVPFPGNILQAREANFPKEVQLPFPVSWKVSASAFRDAPFIGTGPSTYLFNFTTYKPAEFNALRYWNVAFDTAYNEFLQTLGTLGFIGLVGLILFALVILALSRRNLTVHGSEAHDDGTYALLPALAVSGFVSVLLLAIHATTLVSLVMTLFVIAVFMVSQRSIRERVTDLSLGLKASTSGNTQFDLLPVIIFIIFLIGAVPGLYNAYRIITADYYHRQALAQANSNATLTYQHLQKAEQLNPYIDLYRVDMAQINFALANALVTQRLQNAESAETALNDQDRNTVQTLLAQSINEGRAAVTISPRNARNWEVLASIYRNITGVSQNALAFSLDSYGRAIQRDPLNPALRVNVGGLYYAAQNYDLAIRFFTDAANLKPDYANAYYNLAIALRDKGDFKNAEAVAEQALILVQRDVAASGNQLNNQNYKNASELLADIKAKAPAAQTNSALQNQNPGVDVSGLNNPPAGVATPSAVQANPNARVPQATPTPAR